MKLFWPKDTFEVALTNLQGQKPNRPFDEQVIAFTQSLSKRFVCMRHMPEVVDA